MTITTLKTSTAPETERVILELIDGLDLDRAVDRLQLTIETAGQYLKSAYLSQDSRLHWLEIEIVACDLREHYRARHAETV